MPAVPEPAFRALLADCSRSTFAAFVADLWAAQGKSVEREDDRLLVDGELFLPVQESDAEPPDDGRLVVADSVAHDADAIGAATLHEILLYGLDRDRAAAVFEEHFGRPIDDDWSDLTEDSPAGDAPTKTAEPESAEERSIEGTAPVDDAEKDAEDPDSPAAHETEPSEPPVLPAPARAFVRSFASVVPRDRDEVVALARDRRVQAAVLLVLAVSAGGWWGLFVHQPAPQTPNELPFEAADATFPVEDSYRVVARLHTTVDGETYSITGTRTFVPGDPSVTLLRWSYSGPDGRTTVVRYERNGSYTRQSWRNAADYRSFRDAARDTEEFVRAVDATRTVYTADPDGVSVGGVFGTDVPLSMLAQVPYEQRGTTEYDGREVARYVPEPGWVTRAYGLLGDRRATWVRTTNGEVLVAPDDGRVLHADVEATVVDAETWWDALTGSGSGMTVRYRVESDVERPAAPPWVTEIDTGNGSDSPTETPTPTSTPSTA
ncbi:hypothetical protein [Halolamina sp. C58]|uniref:hypothetical protein n=1 Tax=Halolamina sp. C58 TaxID=3421640 RepID=UPI003EBA7CF9